MIKMVLSGQQMKIASETVSKCQYFRSSEASCLKDHGCHLVRVHVACRTTILEVTLALGLSVAANTDGCTSVCHTPWENIKLGSLVSTRHALVVVLTISIHVLLVFLS